VRVSPPELARQLRAEQDSGGGFACTITHRDGRVELDHNGFATALVLRELRLHPAHPALDEVTGPALGLLERCADPSMRGAYGFWPVDERPGWARGVPADCDDTAVLSLELLRAGRRSLAATRDAVFDVLVSSLVTDVPTLGPSWIRPLTFPTWLDPDFGGRANIVDCAVNANVLALMAVCELRDLPGYIEAASMIDAAIAEVTHADPRRRAAHMWSLAPYYPDPRVFDVMLEHAIACGVQELRFARRRLHALLAEARLPPAPLTLCANAYSEPVWHCPAFDLIIRLRPLGAT
jgi:hypothetical protein